MESVSQNPSPFELQRGDYRVTCNAAKGKDSSVLVVTSHGLTSVGNKFTEGRALLPVTDRDGQKCPSYSGEIDFCRWLTGISCHRFFIRKVSTS